MHLFLKKIYRKNPFPKIYRINQCEVLIGEFIRRDNISRRMNSPIQNKKHEPKYKKYSLFHS